MGPVLKSSFREGMAKLGQEIAQLMAALTQTRWGSSPTSAPGSPQECGHRCGHSGMGTTSCLNSHNIRGGLGQMTPAYSLPIEYGIEGTGSGGGEQGIFRPSVRGEGAASH